MMAMAGVGTLNEKALHAQLKDWYARPGDRREVPVDGYIIDLVRGEQLIEIQTRNLGAMRRKLEVLTLDHPVHVLFPVASSKWLTKIDAQGEIVDRRRSPKRQGVLDVFGELVSLPTLLDRANLTLEVVLIEEDELRRHEPGTRWRTRGWATLERRLVSVSESVLLDGNDSLMCLLPTLSDGWTTAELAQSAGISRRLAQQVAYCLRKSGRASLVGKQGNAAVYSLGRPPV